MRLVVTPELFPGNFVKELPAKRVISTSRPNGVKRRQVLLSCLHCEKHFEIDLSNALRTQQKYCSTNCYRRSSEAFQGGNEKHPLYKRWLSMTQRVCNPASNNFINYGGRGIKIRDGLDNFVEYVTYVTALPNYPLTNLTPNIQLDRIDNNSHYCKGNLRWTNQNTQVANQRGKANRCNKYVGVNWSSIHKRWVARVNWEGKMLCSSVHLTQEQALAARNEVIKANSLPHLIQEFTT